VTQPAVRFPRLERAIMIAGFAAAVTTGIAGYAAGGRYGERSRSDPRVLRVRDGATGTLRLIAFDADGDGRFDTWCHMEGDRVYQLDLDDNGDGRIDRREFYGSDGALLRTEVN
jgi:hypothetical protein